MRIAGSEFDMVEMVLRPIGESELLWNDLDDVPRPARPEYDEITVRVPSRVNVHILDMTKLVPSGQSTLCDAGSISFGIDLRSQVRLVLRKDDDRIVVHDDENRLILQHRLRILRTLTDYRGGFELWSRPNDYRHIGLGSTASLTCAASLAVNIALGSPFKDRELVRLDANNYVESDSAGEVLLPGQSTGASGWVASRGGLCVVASGNELVYRGEMPDDYRVIIGIPELKEIVGRDSGKGIGDSDVEMPFLNKLRHYDRFNASKICYWTLMELIPAVAASDIEKFGDVVWDMVLTGSKGVPTILAHGTYKPLDCLLALREAGVAAAFVSSVGPSIVTIASPDRIEATLAVFRSHGCNTIETSFDNHGLEILEGVRSKP